MTNETFVLFISTNTLSIDISNPETLFVIARIRLPFKLYHALFSKSNKQSFFGEQNAANTFHIFLSGCVLWIEKICFRCFFSTRRRGKKCLVTRTSRLKMFVFE